MLVCRGRALVIPLYILVSKNGWIFTLLGGMQFYFFQFPAVYHAILQVRASVLNLLRTLQRNGWLGTSFGTCNSCGIL